jgi:MoeA C-terminal region (domain IV)
MSSPARRHDPPRPLSIPAGFSFDKQRGVRQFLLGELRTDDDGKSVVVPRERQGTAMLSTLMGGDGFMVLDEDRDIVLPGELVDFIPLRGYILGHFRADHRLLATPSWREPICGMICRPDEATVHKIQMKGRPNRPPQANSRCLDGQ